MPPQVLEVDGQEYARRRAEMETGQRALLSAAFNLPALIQALLGEDSPQALVSTAGSNALGKPTSDGLGRQYELDEHTLLIHRPFDQSIQIIVSGGQQSGQSHTMLYQRTVTASQIAELKGFYVLATSNLTQTDWTGAFNGILNPPVAANTVDTPETPAGSNS